MPDERSDQTRGSWKRKIGPTARQPERERHGWTRRGARPEAEVKLPSSGAFKLVSTAVGFLACLVAIVVLIYLIQPPPPAAVVLVGADYAENLAVPQNVLGWEGIGAIMKVSKSPRRWSLFNPAELQLINDNRETLDYAEAWDALIDGLVKKQITQPTVLVVVALHGGSGPDGAYLIPGKMSRPEERLDLKHVIESMAKLPENKQKILVLEGAQVPADWRLGMVHNDFARRLEELEPEIRKVKNLWVLSGGDVDQRCWASEGLGRTIFTHYIAKALSGGPDGPAGSDGRLTLDELYNYVRKNVRNWAWNARGAIQEPVLLPRTKQPSKAEREGEEQDKRENIASMPPSKVYLAAVENAPAPPLAAPRDLKDVRQAWQQFQTLNKQVPHPSVYSPRRWRQYRAELVRYEELVRTGVADKTSASRGRLATLERLLNNERFLKKLPQSIENTLAMNAVTGGQVEISSAAPPEFLRFWKAPRDSEALKIWEGIRAAEVAAEDDARPSRRVQADDYLIQLAAREPVNNLKTAADRLTATKGTEFSQPAEAHYLRMLARALDPLNERPPKVWALVTQSLLLRRQAERTAVAASESSAEYSYSEQVYPWIKALVGKADQERRLGEDYLLSSEETAWDRAEKSLTRARELYLEAQKRAGTVRAALAVRDRSLSLLPDYSRWLPHRRPDELGNDLTSSVENLWTATHQLATILEKPQGDAELTPLTQFTRTLTQGLERLTKRFSDQGALDESVPVKEDWETATAATAVAFADSPDLTLRNEIWRRLENIQKHDLEVAQSGGEMVKLTPEDREKAVGQIRRRAQGQGIMALAVLGVEWFNNRAVFKNVDQGDFAATSQWVRRGAGKDEESVRTWSRELALAGGLIGERWRQMAPEIDSLANEESGISDFAGFQKKLTAADRLGRQIDGGAPALVESASEASSRYRQTRVHDLVLDMAERTWKDHWYDEDAKTRYYQVAGSRFTNDVGKMFPQSLRVKEVQTLLDQKDRLDLDGPSRLVLTSEPSSSLVYRIATTGKVPEGVPVVKPTLDRLLELDGGEPGFRVVSRVKGSDSVAFGIKSPLLRQAENDPNQNRPVVEPTSLTVEGYFRGQKFARTTEIELHPVPDTVAIGPPPADPAGASIAIRASQEIIDRFGSGTGTIAIVLDCSGSMVTEDPRKFEDAKQALTRVLAQLPPGTTVSLWTFGQLMPGAPMPNVGDPIMVEPERTIHRFRKPAPWAPNQVQDVVKLLNSLRPFTGTPLVQAMWGAADQDLRNAKGMRTLLVLTDGKDSRFDENTTFNPGRIAIPQFIPNFKPLKVRINMIYFTSALADPAEVKKARTDFEGPLKNLDPPGTFVTAANLDQLMLTLRRAVLQKLTCQIVRPNGEPVGEEPLDVTGPGETDKWWLDGLEPGVYKLRVHADTTYEQEIDLKKGDRIIIQLTEGPSGGIAFERALTSDGDEFRNRVQEERGNWRLAVLANQRQRQGANDQLRMFAALERKQDQANLPRIEQVQPRLTWFHLEAEDVRQPETAYAVRWRQRIFYPGPAWEFDVPRWINAPAGGGLARPILRAWWLEPDSRFQPSGVLRLDSPGNTDALPREVRVDGDKSVTVESVGIEDHYVEVRPREPLQVKPCLVVRLAFPKDSPYLVDPDRLTGLENVTVGHEHRVYTRAGKYTGLFWPVNQPQFQKLGSLSLIGLSQFRNEAEKQKNTVAVKLPQPRIEDRLPSPPAAIRKKD